MDCSGRLAKGVRDDEVVRNDVAWVAVNNQSAQPVYQVIVILCAISPMGDSVRVERPIGRACVGVVPPGRGYIQLGAAYHGMHRRPGIEIGFQDHLGQAWARQPWGELIQLSVPTVVHYYVSLPTSWIGLEAEIPDQEDWSPFDGMLQDEEWEGMQEMYGDRGGGAREG